MATASASTPVLLKRFTRMANAGDVFASHLARRWFGAEPELAGEAAQERDNLILVGSILHWADRHSTVCGAGFISDQVMPGCEPKRIVLTRGPWTIRRLQSMGIPAPKRFADPGVLAPRLFADSAAVPGRIGLVPHYADLAHPWVESCRELDVEIVDPTQPLGDYFRALQRCEAILASSLHGLVFAHAFGRPALWIELGDRVHGNGFKFYDYYASLGIGADQVRRIAIAADCNPRIVVTQATCPSIAHLVANAEEALDELCADEPA